MEGVKCLEVAAGYDALHARFGAYCTASNNRYVPASSQHLLGRTLSKNPLLMNGNMNDSIPMHVV